MGLAHACADFAGWRRDDLEDRTVGAAAGRAAPEAGSPSDVQAAVWRAARLAVPTAPAGARQEMLRSRRLPQHRAGLAFATCRGLAGLRSARVGNIAAQALGNHRWWRREPQLAQRHQPHEGEAPGHQHARDYLDPGKGMVNLELRHSVSRHKGANCGLIGTLIKIKMT